MRFTSIATPSALRTETQRNVQHRASESCSTPRQRRLYTSYDLIVSVSSLNAPLVVLLLSASSVERCDVCAPMTKRTAVGCSSGPSVTRTTSRVTLIPPVMRSTRLLSAYEFSSVRKLWRLRVRVSRLPPRWHSDVRVQCVQHRHAVQLRRHVAEPAATVSAAHTSGSGGAYPIKMASPLGMRTR